MTKAYVSGIEDGHLFYISVYGIKNSLEPMNSGQRPSQGLLEYGSGMSPYLLNGVGIFPPHLNELTAEVIYKRDAQYSFPNAEIHYPEPIISEDGD